ncbi:MAG: MerR family transcriptional regulator [Gammaproteobacteria bacterium]
MPLPDVQFYGISEAARRAEIAEGTLRDYCRRGVIQAKRDSAGRRIFTEGDINAARTHRQGTRHASK